VLAGGSHKVANEPHSAKFSPSGSNL